MRVLYLYRTDRGAIYEKVNAKETSDFPLYGLIHLQQTGIHAEFFDEDRVLSSYRKSLQRLFHAITNLTGLGWNIGQALNSLRRISDYDLVFATTDSTGLPMAFLKRLGLIKIPLVMASQGLSQSLARRGWNWAFRLHKWSLQAVAHVVYYGWAEGEQLRRAFGVPEDRLSWIPIGVDVSFFTPPYVADAGVAVEDVILSVGLDMCRDYPLLFQVARRLPFRFRIVASRQHAIPREIPPNVELLFDRPLDEIRRWYASSRIVVLPVKPSTYSFATTTLLECLSMEKPVIVSRTDAVGTLDDGYRLKDGLHCVFVPVGDADAISRAINHLWKHPRWGDAIGKRGRRLVEQQYSSRAFATRLATLFQSLS